MERGLGGGNGGWFIKLSFLPPPHPLSFSLLLVRRGLSSPLSAPLPSKRKLTAYFPMQMNREKRGYFFWHSAQENNLFQSEEVCTFNFRSASQSFSSSDGTVDVQDMKSVA